MDWLNLILLPLAKIVVITFGFAMLLGTLLTYVERKQSAIMQRRVGPNRANLGPLRLQGVIHIAADGIKTLFKEDFIPDGAHKKFHTLAPALGLLPAMVIFAIIPFMDYWCHGTPAVINSLDFCLPETTQFSGEAHLGVGEAEQPDLQRALGALFPDRGPQRGPALHVRDHGDLGLWGGAGGVGVELEVLAVGGAAGLGPDDLV
jgi:hypothetical protein